jgi:hypothetical protein
MIEDKLGLEDSEYWGDPWRTRKAAQRELMNKGDEGLVLGAPSEVPLNQRQTVPAALIRVSKLTSVRRIPSAPCLILAASDLQTYELRAGLALPPAPPTATKTRGSGKKDSFSNDTTAMVSEGHTLDLAARLGIPTVRGEHVVTAILLDKVSNQCRVKVVESAGYQDPAVDEFVKEFRASKLKPEEVSPPAGTPLPNYQADDDSLDVPTEVGFALSLSRVQAFDPEEAECVLRGSYRLPIQPQHATKTEEGEESPEDTSRVPISLLLTGSADPTPIVLKLVVPSFEPLESDGDQQLATGHFALDLCQMTNLMVTPQTYFVYAFSGEVQSRPVQTAFVRLPVEELESVESG